MASKVEGNAITALSTSLRQIFREVVKRRNHLLLGLIPYIIT